MSYKVLVVVLSLWAASPDLGLNAILRHVKGFLLFALYAGLRKSIFTIKTSVWVSTPSLLSPSLLYGFSESTSNESLFNQILTYF
jgi:hypothetical protein